MFHRWEMKEKSALHKISAFIFVCHLILNFAFTAFLLTVATSNYPGGTAIMRLHTLEQNSVNLNIHIDVFSCQTGVSRFTELNSFWK